MKNIKSNKMMFIFLFLWGFLNVAYSQELTVIAHKDIGFKMITSKEIKYIYLGKVHKINGKVVSPVTLKSGSIHEHFLDEYVKKNSRQFLRFWKKILFTGKGKPPKTFKTEADMVKYVASTPGAIGYVSVKSKTVGVIRLKVN